MKMFCILPLILFLHYYCSGLSVGTRQEIRFGMVNDIIEAFKYANKPLSQALLSYLPTLAALKREQSLAPFAHTH